MTYRLLFADDSATMHRVLEITLAQEDVAILAARDGHEALAHSRQITPDVALIDIDMPGLDGYAVCRELRQDPRTAHIPILLLESSQTPLDSARAREVGASGSVVKPFETQVLLAQLAKARGESPGAQATAEALATPAAPVHPAHVAGVDSAEGASAHPRPSFFAAAAPISAPAATLHHAPSPSEGASQSPSLNFGLTGDVLPPHATETQPQEAAMFIPPVGDDITFVGPPRHNAALKTPRSLTVHSLADLAPQAQDPHDASGTPFTPGQQSAEMAHAWLEGRPAQPSASHPHALSPSSSQSAYGAPAYALPELPSWGEIPAAQATDATPHAFLASSPLEALGGLSTPTASAEDHGEEKRSHAAFDEARIIELIRLEVSRQLRDVLNHLAPAAAQELSSVHHTSENQTP